MLNYSASPQKKTIATLMQRKDQPLCKLVSKKSLSMTLLNKRCTVKVVIFETGKVFIMLIIGATLLIAFYCSIENTLIQHSNSGIHYDHNS